MIKKLLLAVLLVVGTGIVIANDPVPECNPCPWVR